MDAEAKEVVKQIIPPLTFSTHKGQGGRVGVLGGCRDYTGAPYYAAMSALRTGAELSHVFCSEGAALAIKSYSPELIVHAVVPDTVPDDSDAAVAAAVAAVTRWFPALDVLVIGPGLGRDAHMLALAARVAQCAIAARLPLVVDGDGLWMVAHNLAVVRGAHTVVLTPNLAEYSRLAAAVAGRDPAAARATDAVPPVQELAAALAGPTVLQKGARSHGGADVVAAAVDSTPVLCCAVPGAPRRCGGQGDVLAGATAAFFAWLARHNRDAPEAALSPVHAALGAAALTRTAARLAFESMRRAMLTTDIIQCLGDAFESFYGGDSNCEDEDEDE